MKYRIGTRSSRLATIQTGFVKKRLEEAFPEDSFDIVPISTKGDVVVDRPIAEIGDSSLFTREIETALLENRIDLAVHSMKDLAAECPDGLVLAKAWKREYPRDVLVAKPGIASFADLPVGAKVATGSVRRDALLRRKRPDIEILPMRGNVDTRLRKLFSPAPGEPELDAIVIAAAGLKRLGRESVITEYLDPEWMVPAPNQGQLAIELRSGDAALKEKVDSLGDDAAEAIAFAERAFLKENGGDCRRPVGALAESRNGRMRMRCVSGTSADDLVFSIREAGVVTLVGAGPGDPGLVTVKGLAAIREADAIVCDRLIPGELLKEAKPGCEIAYAGKAAGRHSMPQDEINALLAELALRHRNVVRLKGGDPFVFGRGGEEMAFLAAHSIPCRSIPGVTSAIAAPASFGIPVTCRGVASGFEVLTAHAGGEGRLEIDFSRIVDEDKTYVFLMGFSRVGEIASSCIAAGKDPAENAAVIGSATTPNAKCVTGTLADIAKLVEKSGMSSPAVMVVGKAAGLSAALGFPLAGKSYLVPVIEGSATRLGEKLRALGANVDEVVVGRIVKIDNALHVRDLDGVDRIVLTSKNGRLGLDDAILAEAKARGIKIEEVREVKPCGATLHLTQPDAARVEGVRAIDVYRNEETPIAETFDLGVYDGAVFTCASSARRLMAHSRGATSAFAIGPKTAEALASCGVSDVKTAAEPTLDALLHSVVEWLEVHNSAHASSGYMV